MRSRGRRTRRIIVFLGIGAAAVTGIIWFGRPTSSEKRLLLLLLTLILVGVEPLVQAWDSRRINRKDGFPLDSGVAIIDLIPEGTVKIQGEFWKAGSEDGSRISAGSRVKAVERKGLTLIVHGTGSGPV